MSGTSLDKLLELIKPELTTKIRFQVTRLDIELDVLSMHMTSLNGEDAIAVNSQLSWEGTVPGGRVYYLRIWGNEVSCLWDNFGTLRKVPYNHSIVDYAGKTLLERAQEIWNKQLQGEQAAELLEGEWNVFG